VILLITAEFCKCSAFFQQQIIHTTTLKCEPDIFNTCVVVRRCIVVVVVVVVVVAVVVVVVVIAGSLEDNASHDLKSLLQQ